MGALPTPQAQQPMGQNAAFQKRLELIFDKLGQACPSFLFDLGKEGLDVVLDDLVERGVFRSPVSPAAGGIAAFWAAPFCVDGFVVPVATIGMVRVPLAYAG